MTEEGTPRIESVFVIGGVSLDRIVSLGSLPEGKPGTVFAEGCRDRVGSTGAGKALNLARLGFRVSLHALVGSDSAGEAIRSFFAGQPLTARFPRYEGPSETHVNLMDRRGGRLSIYTSYPPERPKLDIREIGAELAACDLVALNIAPYARALIPCLRGSCKKIWCDIHDWDGENPYHREFIDAADAVFMSDENLADWEGTAGKILGAGKDFVLCTHGMRGSTLFAADGSQTRAGVYPVEATDSNGAGDAYFAGFLFGRARGLSAEGCMRAGAVAAARCVASDGLYDPGLSPGLVVGSLAGVGPVT